MYPLLQDLRYGARVFAKSPGFSAAALLVLALGLGATTAIFSVVDAVLIKPLPFRDSGRLLVIWEKNSALNLFRMVVAPVNYQAWREARSFEAIAAVHITRVTLTAGPQGHMDPEELKAERVSAGLFPLLGVQPVVGRNFSEAEDRPGANIVVLFSHRLWQRRFGGDPAIRGKAIQLGNRTATVVGILPPGISVIDPEVDVWLPLAFDFSDARRATGRNWAVIARLKEDVGIERAKAEMAAIGASLERANPALNKGWRPSVFRLRDELLGGEGPREGEGRVEKAVLLLSAAVGLLLLMTCANVANLLLARGAARRKEIAVRIALGAGRGRVGAQLLLESEMLALAGGFFGVLLARGALSLLGWLGTGIIPRLSEARLDWRFFLFAFFLSLTTGVLFGLAPALQTSGPSLNSALAEVPRGGTPGRSARLLRNLLVMLQIALAVVVMIGSGLLMRSFVRLRAADLGFRPDDLLTFRLPTAAGRYASSERRAAYFTQTSERVAALPGVRGVGLVDSLPLRGWGVGSVFSIEGRATLPEDQRPVALVRFVNAAYFRIMGIPLLAGREFAVTDTPQTPNVMIVNRTMARRFWPRGSPLGGRITAFEANGLVAEIVGIVGDVKSERIEGDDWPTIYYPYMQGAPLSLTMVIKTAGRSQDIFSAVAREIHEMDPDQLMPDVLTMDEVVDRSIAGTRFNAMVLGVFAAIAFVLAAVGLYGVIAYDVSQRTNEFGIRLALGAQNRDILKLVMGQGALLALGGIAVGLAAAFGLTRLMSAMLFGIPATDAQTFGGIALALGAVALVASYLPARRAIALDPVIALRHE